MNCKLIAAFALPLLLLCNIGSAQKLTSDIPYVENGHERQVLDIYTRESAADESLPVVFGSTAADGRSVTRAMSR